MFKSITKSQLIKINGIGKNIKIELKDMIVMSETNEIKMIKMKNWTQEPNNDEWNQWK